MGSRRGRAATAVVLTALLTGCGAQPSDDGGAGEPTPAPGGSPMVSCGGGPGWPASVMADGVGSSFRAEARTVFADLLEDREIAVELRNFLPNGPDTEYRVLRDDGDALALGVGPWSDAGPERGGMVLGLERRDGAWEWTGGGGCRLEPVLAAGSTWVDVRSATPSPTDDRDLSVRLSERECVSGRDPGPFLQEPTVTETDSSVVLSWTSEPLREAATCIGNPAVTRTVTLAEPLGDRAVLDGSTWPPSEVPLRAGSGR